MLTQAEGNNPVALGDGYGRVTFGANEQTLGVHRHSSGSNDAPPGEWLRISSSQATHWIPRLPLTQAPGAEWFFRLSGVLNAANAVGGGGPPQVLTGLVIFRGALQLSGDASGARQLELTSLREALRRAGGPTSTDDRRYMTWLTSGSDNGSYRTNVDILPLTISVNIPSPPGLALVALGILSASRKRKT